MSTTEKKGRLRDAGIAIDEALIVHDEATDPVLSAPARLCVEPSSILLFFGKLLPLTQTVEADNGAQRPLN